MSQTLPDSVAAGEMDLSDFRVFEEKAGKVNQYYRRGLFEARLDAHTYEIIGTETTDGISLDDAAATLAEVAMRKLSFLESDEQAEGPPPGGQGSFKAHEIKVYARSITNAYELADYFLRAPQDIDRFLKNILNLLVRNVGDGLLQTVASRVRRYMPEGQADLFEDNLVRIADEFLLMGLCAVHSIYRGHTAHKYEEAWQQLQILERMIRELGIVKKQKSFGLLALHQYLAGRILFGLGRFNEAEKAFAESAEYYSERIKSKSRAEAKPVNGVDEEHLLSLRRTMLARCLGSAYLYFVQSKLERSLELLKIGVPILTFDCGRVIAAYCDLIEAMATHALYADDDDKLVECEEKVLACGATFERYVPHGHYLQLCQLELIRIKESRAKIAFDGFDGSNEILRAEINHHYKGIYRLLEEVTDYAGAHQSDDDRNRRLATAALILRSQSRRHHLRRLHKIEPLGEEQRRHIKECVRYAEAAYKKAGAMKQLKCEALLAWGQALQFDHFTAPGRAAEDAAKVEEARREEIREKYFEALTENDRQNPRITATALLGLTELEMTGRGNYYLAKRYFEKYDKIAPQIEDSMCRLYAKNLRAQLERPHADFFVDADHKERLSFTYWKKELEKFLIRQAMYRIARERRGELPAQDTKPEKGGRGKDKKENSANKAGSASGKPGRQTRQSILTRGLMEELKLSRAHASVFAGKNLEEFKRIAREEERLVSLLNSPD
jgi:GGDEF domain-containing protein